MLKPLGMSPSSRRAWIEILFTPYPPKTADVALLAEGVDRNTAAWQPCEVPAVALLAEGVDRNLLVAELLVDSAGRPPRGGRG